MAAILFVMLTTTATAYDVTISDESYTSLYAAATTNAVLCEPATGDPNTALVWANADMPMTEDPNSHTWGWTAPEYGAGIYQIRLFDKNGSDPNFAADTLIDIRSLLVLNAEKYFYDGSVSASVIAKMAEQKETLKIIIDVTGKIKILATAGQLSDPINIQFGSAVELTAWDNINKVFSATPAWADTLISVVYNPYTGSYNLNQPTKANGSAWDIGQVWMKVFGAENTDPNEITDAVQYYWSGSRVIEGSFRHL